MRSTRRKETQVLGYLIERIDQFGDDGLMQARCYEIRCATSGATIGQQPSLRAARRMVVLHELRGFTQQKKSARQQADTARVA